MAERSRDRSSPSPILSDELISLAVEAPLERRDPRCVLVTDSAEIDPPPPGLLERDDGLPQQIVVGFEASPCRPVPPEKIGRRRSVPREAHAGDSLAFMQCAENQQRFVGK